MARQADIISDQGAIMQAQSKVLSDTLATNREIERAYISFIHKRIDILGTSDGHGGFNTLNPIGLSVEIYVRNTGRTPGTFLGGYIGYNLTDKPSVPDLKRGTRLFAPAFLHPGETVDFWVDVKVSDDPKAAPALKGEAPLWIVGVADYEDRFGELHQAGYSRKYSAKFGSLQFTQETGDWIYDRPMHPDNVRGYADAKSQKQEPDA